MMADLELTDLDTLKLRLSILHNDKDADLEFCIRAASRAVVTYLDVRADEVLDLDTAGELPSGPYVPPDIEAATLYLAGVMFRNPDGATAGDYDGRSLPPAVVAFLRPYRDHPLA